jgi:hypothetical protein
VTIQYVAALLPQQEEQQLNGQLLGVFDHQYLEQNYMQGRFDDNIRNLRLIRLNIFL